MQLHLPKPLQQTLQTHLVTAYPEEGCALLIGRVTSDTFTVEAIQPVANAAPAGTRLRRYAIKPADIAQADRVARANGQDIIGVAHSHPDHPAVPSARDLAEAWPILRMSSSRFMPGWQPMCGRGRLMPAGHWNWVSSGVSASLRDTRNLPQPAVFSI